MENNVYIIICVILLIIYAVLIYIITVTQEDECTKCILILLATSVLIILLIGLVIYHKYENDNLYLIVQTSIKRKDVVLLRDDAVVCKNGTVVTLSDVDDRERVNHLAASVGIIPTAHVRIPSNTNVETVKLCEVSE